MGGLAKQHPGHVRRRSRSPPPPSPASRRSPGSSPRTRSSGSRSRAARGGSPLLCAVAAATALMTAFYMFRLLWLTFFGALADEPRGRAPRARVAAVDDRRAGRARRAVGGRRLRLDPALPRAACCRCPRSCPSAAALRDAAARRARSCIALRGPRGAAWFFGGDGARAEACGARFAAAAPRARPASTSSTSSTSAVLGRPLDLDLRTTCSSPRRPAMLIDGTLDGMARARAAHRRRALAHPDRQPAPLRAAGARGHGGVPRVELVTMADAGLAQPRCCSCPSSAALLLIAAADGATAAIRAADARA